jgi:pimeloyl-ACP methyl ester carboxylesterase
VFRDVAGHGDRLSPARGRDAIEDLLGCAVLEDVLRTSEELAPLDPVPCPVTLAWSVKDDILPLSVSGLIARARIPGATFYVLPGVGHVPMIDDPDLVLATILHATVGRAWATATP